MKHRIMIDRWKSRTRSLLIVVGLAWPLGLASASAIQTTPLAADHDARMIISSDLSHKALPKSASALGSSTNPESVEHLVLGSTRYQIQTSTPTAGCMDAHASPGSRIMDCTIVLLSLHATDPGRANLYVQRALAYYASNAWQMALQDFETAIDLNPDLALALNGRCWILASRALDLVQAREDCDKAIAIDSTFHEAFDSRAMISMREAKWEAAWADFNAAMSLRSGVATYLYGRGLASLALGAREEGQRDLSAAKALRSAVALEYRDLGFDPAQPPFQIASEPDLP